MCSTPDGVGGFITSDHVSRQDSGPQCSTPDGVGGFITVVRLDVSRDIGKCSTPDGVGGFITIDVPRNRTQNFLLNA